MKEKFVCPTCGSSGNINSVAKNKVDIPCYRMALQSILLKPRTESLVEKLKRRFSKSVKS